MVISAMMTGKREENEKIAVKPVKKINGQGGYLPSKPCR
jgi:hypothetical protein